MTKYKVCSNLSSNEGLQNIKTIVSYFNSYFLPAVAALGIDAFFVHRAENYYTGRSRSAFEELPDQHHYIVTICMSAAAGILANKVLDAVSTLDVAAEDVCNKALHVIGGDSIFVTTNEEL